MLKIIILGPRTVTSVKLGTDHDSCNMSGGRALTLRETGLATQVRHEKLTNRANGHWRGWWSRVSGQECAVRSENDEKREERRGDLSDGRAVRKS